MSFAPRRIGLRSSAPPGARLVLRALLLASCALLCPSSSSQSQSRTPAARPRQTPRPTTLADYRARVSRAAAALEKRAFGHEAESDGAYIMPDESPADVPGLLPRTERVEWGAGFVEVDNGWLYEALEEVEAEHGVGQDERRAQQLRAAAVRLRSLEARLAEVEGGVAGGAVDRDAERGRLNAILRGPEFGGDARRQQGGALRRLVEEFFEWLSGLFPRLPIISMGESPRASLLTQVMVGALCLAVLAYVARLLWLRRGKRVRPLKPGRKERVVLGERVKAEQTASDLLDDAERLARGGDLRGAMRKAYVALLCELGDRGVVRLARHKTNRDYLDAVRRGARAGLYTEMLPITTDFETHWYGLRDASHADWESFRTRCRKTLKEVASRQ
jgi:hypothetical protein